MDLLKKILFRFIIPPLGMIVISLLAMTCRKEFVGKEFEQSLNEKGIRPIYAMWHGRILLMPYVYRWHRWIYCLASPSLDGDIIAGIIRLFGLKTIRGSSFKGGGRAFRELVRVVREGKSAAIIVDGSRGPASKVQGGVIHLAMLGGAPVLPLTFSAKNAMVLKSWDRFMIPKPFSRVVIVLGDPIHVGREMSEDQIEEKRQVLEKRLNDLTAEADSYFKV